jgi:signal transduction histidine kinase
VDNLTEEFLDLITHEVQTPLVPILGFSQALQYPEIFGKLTKQQLEAIEIIFRNSNNLQTMITNVLDFINLETGKMKFYYKEFNVNDLIMELCEECDFRIREKKIQIISKIEKNLILDSDRFRIKKVLRNLIYNAISFVPNKNGKIEIGASEQGKYVLFYVKDNGKGMDKPQQKEIFKIFYQVVQGKRRKHGGLGLGLAVCSLIVKNLGGKIWVESNLGIGSVFYFNISRGNCK